METIAKIRRRHEVNGESISEIARRFNLSRNTVRKYLNQSLKFPRNYSSHHAQQHSDQRISGGIAGFGANPGKILIQSCF
uniref:helix-turn-helix domain-containing protein n=1 Tax=Thiolapillus sp. TaxID=2017437 RepID=UPI0035ABACB2